MKSRIILALLPLVMLATSCFETEDVIVYGGVYGVISDKTTGEPISGASVVLAPGNMTTVIGYDGHYEFRELDAKQYLLSVSADGYASNSRQVTVIPDTDVICSLVLETFSGVRISNTHLFFSEQDVEKQIVLSRVGNQTASWMVADCPNWCKVYPEEGSISLEETSKSLQVVIDRNKAGSVQSGSFTLVVNGINNVVAIEIEKSDNGGSGEEPTIGNVANGLYGYYTFEGNTNNLVDGAVDGGAINSPEYVDGVRGKAIKLSVRDNSYVSFAEPMIANSAFSISFWVKGLSDGHIFHMAGSRSVDGIHSFEYILSMKDGRLGFDKGYTYYYAPDRIQYFIHQSIDGSKWNMITLTAAKGGSGDMNCVLYVNGRKTDVKSLSTDMLRAYKYGLSFILGGKMEMYNDSFVSAAPMTVDNLRFYSARQLSDNEVLQIYNYEKQ